MCDRMDNEFFEDDEFEGSEDEIDIDNPESAIGAALNFGLSTDAIEARKMQEQLAEEEEIYGPPQPPPETQQERIERKIREPTVKKGSPVKLPAHAVEKGRKMVQDKLEEEQLLERASLADKIQKYYKFFPHIKENAPKKGKISSSDTLKLLQQEFIRCEKELNNSNTYESIKKADVIFSYLTEKVFCMFGQNAGMYTVVAKESQHIVEQELKEFSIKYGDIFSMGPEWRYFFKKMQIMMTVIENNNKGIATMSQQVDPAQEELRNKKYADLN